MHHLIKLSVLQVGLCLCCLAAVAGEAQSFEQTLDKHLKAINAHDYTALAETLPKKGALTLISPEGEISKTAEAFKTMHEGWFKTPGWTMDLEIMEKRQEGNLGFALVLYDYREKERDGKPYRNRLFVSLVFAKQDGQWVLVFDQATAAKKE